MLFTLEPLPNADGDVTVYLGSSDFPPHAASNNTYCKGIGTTVTTALVTQTTECVVPITSEYIYIVANGTGPLSLCDVKVMLAGKAEW